MQFLNMIYSAIVVFTDRICVSYFTETGINPSPSLSFYLRPYGRAKCKCSIRQKQDTIIEQHSLYSSVIYIYIFTPYAHPRLYLNLPVTKSLSNGVLFLTNC